MDPPQRGSHRGRGRGRGRTWFPYQRNRTGRRPDPTISVPITNAISDNTEESGYGSSSIRASHHPDVLSMHFGENTGQYPGWNLYFPEEIFTEGSNLARKIRTFEEHIEANPAQYDLQEIRKRLCYLLDLLKVLKDESLMLSWSTFKQDLLETPERTLNCVGLAMHQQLLNVPNMLDIVPASQSDLSSKKDLKLLRVNARIQTDLKPISLNSIKVDRTGKLIVVRGNVVRIGSIEYRATWIQYRCLRCNAEQAIKQTTKTETTPKSCRSCGSRSSTNFASVLSSPFTSTEKCQTIHLQELLGIQQSSRVPRTIKIELFQDLVDCVYPGDDVTVTAIVQCPPQDDHQKGEAAMRTMYLKAVSITSNRNASFSWKSTFSEKDKAYIEAIKSKRSPFRLLVHSLSPAIYGHEMVKAGLLLGLLGGSDNPHRRSQSHILVVGDPGLGKSQMLQACAEASPKGIFVCGKTSSTAGLTVSIHHEKGSDTSLGAGALLLADQGTCCIDELDKMSNCNQALLEVMEQQCVSIAKAGVYCSLPARTSVIAAANPTEGHYNMSRTVAENVKMNPALLSRFDLVFMILDRPNAELDSVLHDYRRTSGSMPPVLTSSSSFNINGNLLPFDQESYEPLNIRLKLQPHEKIDHLPTVLLQTYIAYTRKFIHPKLSVGAATLLRNFYLEMRGVQQGCNSIPVTTRQLESMIRLTQARARAELTNDATVEHAHDVITIVRYSMIDVFSTDTGTLQLERSINGSGMSQASQIRHFVKVLQMKSQMKKSVFSTEELKELARNANLQFLSFADVIETMNIQGFLLKKGPNIYKFLNN